MMVVTKCRRASVWFPFVPNMRVLRPAKHHHVDELVLGVAWRHAEKALTHLAPRFGPQLMSTDIQLGTGGAVGAAGVVPNTAGSKPHPPLP
jgi:hypothetical protein